MKKKIIKFYSSKDHEREIELAWEDEELSYRKPFWRDYARLLHSPSFRRLKGKTQLFPGVESDFYRNRLTHSLEVAQIGKSIANFLNWQLNKIYTEKDYDIDPLLSFIDTDLIEFSCHAHDLGHPPFGHQGEQALDEKMKKYGGFEGNAQTLRILTRLEKKELPLCYNTFEKDAVISNDIFNHTIFDNDGDDYRVGLNLTARSLASILKYDNVIRENAERKSVEKGYYRSEKPIVDKLKKLIPNNCTKGKKFKTIECQIMDIADDIAYSIYDMEDAFKGEFLHPTELYSLSLDDKELLEKIRIKIEKKGIEEQKEHLTNITISDIEMVIEDIFYKIFQINNEEDGAENVDISFRIKNKTSIAIAKDGYYRAGFMTDLATSFIRSIKINLNEDYPAISTIVIDKDVETRIEVLKHLTYEYQIKSPKLKAVEFKGKNIISKIFDTLSEKGGEEFLPKDVKRIYKQAKIFDDKVYMRVICDFISGMTDSYAIEFYNRLFSTNIVSIHRPYN